MKLGKCPKCGQLIGITDDDNGYSTICTCSGCGNRDYTYAFFGLSGVQRQGGYDSLMSDELLETIESVAADIHHVQLNNLIPHLSQQYNLNPDIIRLLINLRLDSMGKLRKFNPRLFVRLDYSVVSVAELMDNLKRETSRILAHGEKNTISDEDVMKQAGESRWRGLYDELNRKYEKIRIERDEFEKVAHRLKKENDELHDQLGY